jgi:hypothetical protein
MREHCRCIDVGNTHLHSFECLFIPQLICDIIRVDGAQINCLCQVNILSNRSNIEGHSSVANDGM